MGCMQEMTIQSVLVDAASATRRTLHIGRAQCVQALIVSGKVDASAPIKDGNTPLFAACSAVMSQADNPPQDWAKVKAGALATIKAGCGSYCSPCHGKPYFVLL